MENKNLDFNAVMTIYERYERLDLVPKDYFYPEFLKLR